MAGETEDNKKPLYRKPSPALWTVTLLVVLYAVWCVLLPILVASGHLLTSQSFECWESDMDTPRLKRHAFMVYLWSAFNLLICIFLLINFWIRRKWFLPMLLTLIVVVYVVETVHFSLSWKDETKEMEAFKTRYLALIPLKDEPGSAHTQDPGCSTLHNVHRWQAEFKCCGLESYQDWSSGIPDSCLCGEEDDSSGCVGVGNSLVYEKPCLPTVLPLVQKRSSTFWVVMTVWLTILAAPNAICIPLCFYELCYEKCNKLSDWKYKISGKEKMVPVVFIRSDNNNQAETENGKERGVGDGTRAEGEGGDAAEDPGLVNAISIIPVSALRRLQEELDPPPVAHQVHCLCIFPSKPKNLYTVTIDEGSPLLPGGAVLADPNEPTSCFWVKGPHVFSVEHIVWPRESRLQSAEPLSLF